MVIRHIRKRGHKNDTSSESESDSSSSDSLEEKVVTKSIVNEESRVIKKNDTYSSSDEESDSSESSSSSSDEEIIFHRPILLNKNPTNEKIRNETKPISAISNLNKIRKTLDLEQSERNELNILGNNYSTDQDLIKKILLLNDNDTIDAENEKKLWENRQLKRKQDYKDTLIEKQLLLEQYEANKYKNALLPLEGTELGNDHDQDSNDIPKKKRLESSYRKKDFKPKRVQDMKMQKDLVHTTSYDPNDSEYATYQS
ncbi:hypothetical protein TBLA_0F01180 [Henningerozyma blattae CBS 6284]|uniref:Micro-fibrillar-associated protein 1 C-terminal domain-containing protein n=1 Tax=Henningerozyma blattae (strain ATCC 34711 / CBS 6284 / DSM 70876 / NBRC 10599 / NRRL Y-10934 / UCD 77-7) TaxID=1071380 RepID=I2H5K9_HENB6|nr:hypothetical protein TBLA_0F01180 [Tetrapisispora blattae CBS 6284]CCH61661.1 hypothetical protein TBLA_0F01180 [Tetrapisispora blattae CBS 6284]